MRTPPLVLLLLAGTACGRDLPPRFVVERDVGDFAYRRYQRVLDVEFPVPENPAEGHTATYVQRTRDGRDVILATAFVTVYEQAPSLSSEVRDRLDELGSYDVVVEKNEGEWMWRLDSGELPWLLWVSGRYLVKLGGPPGGAIPEELVETYADLYPSDLNEHGRAREGAASHGASAASDEGEDPELEMPSSLREGAPQ
ncbi:MAG TPA: hypothetical protein RMH85_16140 [Polyangiaceae bacterium LLY-WYZ-15_(1-7)]|nr:hypothetical protein [Myxococcales bacterium]MAT29817.1 hypothetical protein [Sandaracinus sp.]HJL01181.1 hypothetical protein [Polyangiaceae bacterium LLY-WYZ-15_(1-7)]MBJ71092.1 hypothetical protein [Sandaracinus sp.]HJL10032.1 hypothetical protein [Polyangiaceae bacterium LLY-WYZ-15_(1-7)]